METKKLYYSDPFLREFTAAVLSCEEGKGGWSVVLDQTAFYPEGGGQPSDHGTLDGVKVLDVREKGGVITHLCDAPLPPVRRCMARLTGRGASTTCSSIPASTSVPV